MRAATTGKAPNLGSPDMLSRDEPGEPEELSAKRCSGYSSDQCRSTGAGKTRATTRLPTPRC